MNEEHRIKLEPKEVIKQYCCILCEYASPNVAVVKDHMIKVHKKEGCDWWTVGMVVKFICLECDNRFEDTKSFKAHE